MSPFYPLLVLSHADLYVCSNDIPGEVMAVEESSKNGCLKSPLYHHHEKFYHVWWRSSVMWWLCLMWLAPCLLPPSVPFLLLCDNNIRRRKKNSIRQNIKRQQHMSASKMQHKVYKNRGYLFYFL